MGEAEVVDIRHFVDWYESKFAECVSIELEPIKTSLNIVFECLTILKQQADELVKRAAQGATASIANNSNRKLKFIEQIDNLLEVVGFQPPLLPSSDYIDDFITKLRKKLKTIDEMASSTKLTKTEGDNNSILSTVNIRQTVQTILHELDTLEKLKNNHNILISYINEIKISLFIPLNSLLNEYDSITPNTNDIKTCIDNRNITHNMYMNLCESMMFTEIATCKKEAEDIEILVHELLNPLRNIIRNLQHSSSSTLRDPIWSQALLPLLSCQTGELLARCCSKTTIEQFASAVIELQSLLKVDNENNNSAVTESSIASYKLSRKSKLFVDFTEEMKSGIEEFDIELFAAYLDDWRKRVCTIEYRVSSADFEKRYKELVRRRSELNKLNDICELKHKELEDISLKHVHIHKKLIAFKTDLEELCVRDLNLHDIQVLLPVEEDIFHDK